MEKKSNMKRNMTIAACMMMCFMAAACVDDSPTSDPFDDLYGESDSSDNVNGSANSPGSASGQTSIGSTDISTFDILLNTAALSESETIPTDESDEAYDDYVEHSTFGNTISIDYDGASATVTGAVDGVTVNVDGADVIVEAGDTKGMEYVLSGSTTDGCFKVYGEKKFKLTLNGVSITNADGAAINIQNGKRIFVELADGTTNNLTDGSSYNKTDGEDMKGTFFSEGQLIFSGSGTLNVTGYGKHGIASDDYIRFRPGNVINITASAGNGVKTNDGIIINGGVLNVEVSDTAAKGLSTDGYFEVNGGRTTVITTGNGEYDADDNDTSASAGIKADSIFTMNGGELYLKSTGTGGKGINCDQDIVINDGTIRIVTTGERYYYTSSLHSSAKGIKSDYDITINGGDIQVRTTGGEGSEGIEAKGKMYINSGIVEVYSYDDCLNSAEDMYLTGGYIYCYATNNDGIDSNGNIYIQGGSIVALGGSSPECGIDAAEGYNIYMTGGTLLSSGGGAGGAASSSSQASVCFTGNLSANTYISLDEGTTHVLDFLVARTYNGGATYQISSPKLTAGNTVTVSSGATLSGGTEWHGLIEGATVSSAGSTLGTVTASKQISTSMGGFGGPGGGPGGR